MKISLRILLHPISLILLLPPMIFSEDSDFKSNRKPVSPESQRAILEYKRFECEKKIKKEMEEKNEEGIGGEEERGFNSVKEEMTGSKENNKNNLGRGRGKLPLSQENASYIFRNNDNSTFSKSYKNSTRISAPNNELTIVNIRGYNVLRKNISFIENKSITRTTNSTTTTTTTTTPNTKNLPTHVLKKEPKYFITPEINITEEDNHTILYVSNLSLSEITLPKLYCPTTFDNVYCWSRTPADTLVVIPCPSYVQGFSNKGRATRYCTPNGAWYVPPGRNSSWTNYTDCQVAVISEDVNENLLQWTPKIRSMATIGYAVSLATLLVALMLLVCFKNLHCPRNSLHMHLFASFACRAAFAICRDQVNFASHQVQLSPREFIKCRVFTCVWQYCILANYFWILMEGLYLHNIVFLAIFNDHSSITAYILRGWGLPFILVVFWSIARILKENVLCWTTNNNKIIFWVFIRGPISISILISFALFMKITRELFIKLRSKSTFGGKRHSYRQWARSTLVLVPLFGVHYAALLGFGYSMGKHPIIELIWLFTDQFFASLQGFFVATLYCLLNEEVRSEIRKFWLKCKRNSSSIGRECNLPFLQGFRSNRLTKRLNSPSYECSTKPKVSLINTYEMTTCKSEFKDPFLNATKEFHSFNGGNSIDIENEYSTHSLTKKRLSNGAKDRSFSVETCVLHVSSSTDLRDTCLPLINGNTDTMSPEAEPFALKETYSNSVGNLQTLTRLQENETLDTQINLDSSTQIAPELLSCKDANQEARSSI